MPGQRIPDLTAIAGASTANDDNLVIFDTDANTTKRILRSQLAAGIVGDLPYTPSGGISATTVPTAIAELDTEKVAFTRLDDNDGSNLVGFLQAGSGAVPRTAQSKMRDVVSVFDFMTAAQIADVQAGTALVDVTAAIQAALNSGAASVFFPDGNYLITSTITVGSGQSVFGNGGAVITQGANDINCLDISSTLNVEIYGLHFSGAAATLSGTNFTANHAVYGSSTTNATIRNCTIYGFWFCGIQLRNCLNSLIADNLLYGNYFSSNSSASDITLYSLASQGRGTIIRGNRCFSNNSQGIFVNPLGGDEDTIVEGNMIHALNSSWQPPSDYSVNWSGTIPTFSNTLLLRRHGIVLGYNGPGKGRVIVSNNNIRTTAANGIYQDDFNNTNIGTRIVSNNVISDVALGAYEFSLSGGIVFVYSGNGDLITGNLVENVGSVTSGARPAFHFAGSGAVNTSLVISNNVFKKCGFGIRASSFAIRSLQILGNFMYDMSVQGIYLSYGNTQETEDFSLAICNNYIERFSGTSVTQAGIYFSYVFTNFGKPLNAEICGNTVDGNGLGTYGILFDQSKATVNVGHNLNFSNNCIKNVVTGLRSQSYIDARMFNWQFVKNVFHNCTTAYDMGSGLDSSRGIAIVDGGDFFNVTTVFGTRGGFPVLRFGKWVSNKVVQIIDSAVPTTGRWYRGDRILFSNPSAGGKEGAVCVTSGQFGTLSGVTADTTASSATITVNSATNLFIGMTITIAGVTGAKEIASVSGTTVVLTTTCDATTSGAAVANNTPVLKQFGAIDP